MHYIGMLLAVGFAMLSMVRAASAVDARHITTINEQNWRDLLTGEWLVKFYAPWCPACKAMSPAWKNVARWCRKESMLERDVRVADVDVTKNPGLTGRFMVTSLPTIFHTKDGTFRTYTGLREEHDFNTFLEEEKYLQLQPLPWYWAPDSFPMECLSFFFKIAVIVRDVHNAITTTYGLPVWVSYILFAISTIVAGFALALLLVLLCDRVLSSRASPQPPLGSYTCPNVTADDGMDDASDIVEDDLPTPSGDTTDDSRMSGGDFPRPSSTRRRH